MSRGAPLSEFVDAIREVIGLAPLYRDPRRTNVERFASLEREDHRQGVSIFGQRMRTRT